MTPKEKAEELVDSFDEYAESRISEDGRGFDKKFCSKQCALIAVDEIIKSEPRYPSNVDWDDVGGTHQYYYEAQREEALIYWKEVKQEIEKL
jgi:hypothetical protein